MPRKIQVTIYKFSELSEKAKETARSWYREGALDYEWWEHIYEDASNVGLKLTGFELDRRLGAEGKFTENAVDVAKAILKDHGEETETYKDARDFLKDWEKAEKAYYDADEDNEDFDGTEKAGEMEEEFLKTLLNDYAQILQNEYEYQLSDEQVDEAIEANDYEFTKNGDRA